MGQAAVPAMTEAPPALAYPRAANLDALAMDGGCPSGVTGAATGSVASGSLSAPRPLRGDPTFDPASLSPAAGCWYETLWSLITDPAKSAEFTRLAASNDLYAYSRTLNTHVNALLLALRLTGDLRLLDEVDRLAQHMRAELDDAWHGLASMDSGSVDGYLNWVWRVRDSGAHLGRDLHVTDEMRTHALVAQMAWAFHNNADQISPNGVDYAERARFWLTYLQDHFEAKWRARTGVPWPHMPFVTRPHMHESVDFVRYNHYMYLLTDEQPYRREALRLTDVVFGNFRVGDSPSGPALVTPRSILSEGGSEAYLLPSTYVRYVLSDAVDLYFEGVDRWSDEEVLEMLARTLAEFMLDGGEGLARDMGGGVERAGVRASSESDWGRITSFQFANSAYAFLSAWETGDRIAAAALDAYTELNVDQRGVFIPVAMILRLAGAAE